MSGMKFILVLSICGMVLDCAYAPSPYVRKDFTVCNNWIKHYFHKGYSYKDITLFLASLHGFRLGIEGLKKALRSLGLRKRERRTEANLGQILTAVRREIDGSGK